MKEVSDAGKSTEQNLNKNARRRVDVVTRLTGSPGAPG